VLNEAEMPEERAGPVLMFLSDKDDNFRAGNLTGFAKFQNASGEIEVSVGKKPPVQSCDGDGTIYESEDEGNHVLFGYNGKYPATLNATVAISQSDREWRGFLEVFSFGVAGNDTYEEDVQNGSAIKTLSVRTGAIFGSEIKKIEFEATVKQVMSCRHHLDDAQADDIYILLTDGALKKVNGTQLFDDGVAAEDLEFEDIVDEYDGEEGTEKYLGGFCVYGKKCCVFGSSGLYVADLE